MSTQNLPKIMHFYQIWSILLKKAFYKELKIAVFVIFDENASFLASFMLTPL